LTERFSAKKVGDVLGDHLADLRHRRWHR
jgi:hypothetical protein